MTASNELEYLKSLVAQLNDKIHALEAKAKGVPPTPAQQLRTILIGPPGAGTSLFCLHPYYIPRLNFGVQAKGRRRLEYVTNSAYATWQLEICCVSR